MALTREQLIAAAKRDYARRQSFQQRAESFRVRARPYVERAGQSVISVGQGIGRFIGEAVRANVAARKERDAIRKQIADEEFVEMERIKSQARIEKVRKQSFMEPGENGKYSLRGLFSSQKNGTKYRPFAGFNPFKRG